MVDLIWQWKFDGKPIKLPECNADTPTALFESAIIQWAILGKMDLMKRVNLI